MLRCRNNSREYALRNLFDESYDGVVTIGRLQGNLIGSDTGDARNPDIFTAPASVSRLHATMTLVNGQLTVKDNATPNGTFVNGLKINRPVILNSGDLVSFGGDPRVTKDSWTFEVMPHLHQFLATYVRTEAEERPHCRNNVENSPQPPASYKRVSIGEYIWRHRGDADTEEMDSSPQGIRIAEAPISRRRTVRPRFEKMYENVHRSHRPSQHPVDEVVDISEFCCDEPRPSSQKRQKKTSKLVPPGVPEELPEVINSGEKKKSRGNAVPASRGHDDLTDSLMTQFTCAICQDLLVSAYGIVPCGHNYCGECLSTWLSSGKLECPTCRTRATAPPIRQNAIDNAVEVISATLPKEEAEVRRTKKASWENNRRVIEKRLEAPFKPQQGTRASQQRRGIDRLVDPGMMVRMTLDHEFMAEYGQNVLGLATFPLPRGPAPLAGPQNYSASYQSPQRAGHCHQCHLPIEPTALKIGASNQVNRGQRPDWRYYHFECVSLGAWSEAAVRGVMNMRQLAPQDSSRIREKMNSRWSR